MTKGGEKPQRQTQHECERNGTAAKQQSIGQTLHHDLAGRALLGEVTDREAAVTATQQVAGHPARRLVRTGDFDGTGSHYEWIDDTAITAIAQPEWATVVVRAEAGRLHGVPKRLLHGEEVVAEGPEGVWAAYGQEHPKARSRALRAQRID